MSAIQKVNASAAIQKATSDIDQLMQDTNLSEISKVASSMTQSILMGNAIGQLRAALTDEVVKEVFMPLQGSRLGFKTDLSHEGKHYPVPVVRECLIEAFIYGARPVMNEINIISGGPYLTKEYYQRAVAQLPGVSNVREKPGIPKMGDGGALVPFRVQLDLHGEQREWVFDVAKDSDGNPIDERIPVRLNRGMGVDGALGKATRKALKRVYEDLTGMRTPDGDADAIPAEGREVPMASAAPARPRAGRGTRVKAGDVDFDPRNAPPEQTQMREPGED